MNIPFVPERPLEPPEQLPPCCDVCGVPSWGMYVWEGDFLCSDCLVENYMPANADELAAILPGCHSWTAEDGYE